MIVTDPTRLTFRARLEPDHNDMLWLPQPNRYGKPMVRYLLSAVLNLKAGWRLTDITPAERAVLEQHGFASGRVQ